MSLRLLIYCDDHGTGGAAFATHRLALGLAERGYEVDYAETPRGSPQSREREARGIRRVDIPYDTLLQFDFSMRDGRIPSRLFLERRPDVILFSDVLVESTTGAKEAAATLAIPHLVIKHLIRPESLYTRNPRMQARVRQSLAAAAATVTVSENNRAILAGHFPEAADRLTVIPNSVPEPFLRPPAPGRRAAFRRQHAIPDDKVAVLTAAALVQRKGFHHQVRLIRDLQAAGELERFVFVWAGEGDDAFVAPLWRELEEAGCTPAVRRLGFQADVPFCLDGCDVALLPSEEEGMPLVVLEAMARGVPVIASSVGGTPEALAGGGGALIADPGADPAAAVAGMRRWLTAWADDPLARQAAGAAGRARVLAEFTPGLMLDRFEAAIRQAAIRPGDYVSPGLALVNADWDFPCLNWTSDPAGGHNRYFDIRYSRMPMLSRDEVLLIHNTARQFAGGRALEVGGWLGWASWHLLAAGLGNVDVVEPLLAHPGIRAAATGWMLGDEVRNRLRLIVGEAPSVLTGLWSAEGRPWDLILIDVGREGEAPAAILEACARMAAPDAVILVAGLDHPATAAAWSRLRDRGWTLRLHLTASLLGAAWRGNARPAEHVPDPRMPHSLPPHLARLFGAPP